MSRLIEGSMKAGGLKKNTGRTRPDWTPERLNEDTPAQSRRLAGMKDDYVEYHEPKEVW